MKYNLSGIMSRAWALLREKGYTISTALKLAWGEAKGRKLYASHIDEKRTSICEFIKSAIRKGLNDDHQRSKIDCLRAVLKAPCDALGVAVLDGKCAGLAKHAALAGRA